MSDLFELHRDTVNAADERYEETVTVEDTEYDIVFRQARDEETSEFHSVVGKDEREKWKEAYENTDDEEMDEESLRRLKKLQLKKQNGRLNANEEEELDELNENTEGMQELMRLITSNKETVSALKSIAKKVVVPDDEDINRILDMTPTEQQEKFGEYATDKEGAKRIANNAIKELVEKSTNYSSIGLGMQGLFIGQSAGHDPNE